MTYRTLLSEQARFVAAGFALCFFSSFGQTFFIGVFGGAIRAEFGLSHGSFGLLYSLATLTSVVVFLPLIFMGDNATMRTMLSALGIPLCASLLFSLW